MAQSARVNRRGMMTSMATVGLASVFSGDQARAATDGELYDQIHALLKETERIWNSQDFGRLRDVWDTEDNEPWYIPEEIREAFTTWAELDAYWTRGEASGRRVLKAFRWWFDDLKVKRLAADLTLAMFNHYYELEVNLPGATPSAGFDRVLTLFRLKPGGWRHILYAQCPLGPESYVRALRERIVSPDFEAFRDTVEEK